MTTSRSAELRERFRRYHTEPPESPTAGILVMPNTWDIGSTKLLATLGAAALATTSSGHAAAKGRLDQHIHRDELLAHVAEVTEAVDVPFSVDSEDCFGVDLDGVAETARLLATTDAAGFSIEDFDPRRREIRPIAVAAARVQAAREHGGALVLTARAENHLYGVDDLDDTVRRLEAYRDAGADVVYAPGITAPEEIERLVAIGSPLNVLARPDAPAVPQLAELGVARVSVGGSFAWAAYGAAADAAREVFGAGTSSYSARVLDRQLRDRAFG